MIYGGKNDFFSILTMIAQYDAILFLPGNCSGGPKTPRTWSGFHIQHINQKKISQILSYKEKNLEIFPKMLNFSKNLQFFTISLNKITLVKFMIYMETRPSSRGFGTS